jgi:hypothetical protein
MSLTVCLGAYSLRFSKAGAYRSMFLNWALGLKANGINVIWLDSVLKSFSSEYKNEIISELKKELLL